MNFLEYAYKIEASDIIDSYTGYPLQQPDFDYHIPNMLGRTSAQDEYQKHAEQFL